MEKMQQCKAIALTFLLNAVCCFTHVFSQTDPNIPKIIPPSPNAASLGVYGHVPVSLFSGLPQISIPLGNIAVEDVSIPLTLNYHGGGVKPDQHSSWVGLGWDLNAGGIITRKVNGAVDEFRIHGAIPDTQYGDYLNYATADNVNWSSISNLYDYATDIFYNPHYPAPDEFFFNFGKYSGSFFINHKGKWQVKSSDPIFLIVKEETQDFFSLEKQAGGSNNLTLRHIFYKFTLVTPDGCKYIFGGTPESIEFTRDAINVDLTDIDNYNTNVVPTSWHLTKIVTRNAREINFTYQRDGILAPLYSNLLRYQYTASTGPTDNTAHIGNKSASIINPSYLTSISASDQVVKFAGSASNELSYVYDGILNPSLSYPDLPTNDQTAFFNAIKWLKLDSISFYSDESTFLRKIVFSYNNQTTSRLILDSIKEIGSNGDMSQPYKFRYDSTSLPVYNSQMLDHWGFYNGQNYFTTNPKTPLAYVKTDVPAYTTTRNSNFTLMKAGVLTSIQYPTGGVSKFEYEPHEYRKIAKRFPFVVTDTTVNVKCGGLRIKSITNTDAFGNTLTSKQYYYVRNYNAGGLTSSGILAGYPQYLDEGQFTWEGGGTLTYWYWFDFPVQPLSLTEGNHVTYSEVTEKFSDGGYTIYSYSNHDQGTYKDEAPVNYSFTAPQQWLLDPNTSRSLDRGKILIKSDYASGNILLRKVKYDYDTSVARYAENIRMVKVTRRQFGSAIDGRATAYLHYTFPRFLVKETDSLWDQNGSNPIVTVNGYRYNDYRLKSADSTTSRVAAMVKTTYRYPFEMTAGSDPTGIYQQMVDSNMIAPVIEEKHSVGFQTRFVKTNYYSPFTGLYVPQTIDIQNGSSPIETRIRFYSYDTKANVLVVSKEKDAKMSYIWNYKNTLPIAEVANAGETDIAYTSFESDSTGNWNSYAGTITTVTSGTMPPMGKRYYTLTTINTLTKSGLTTSKYYTLSYWTQNVSAFTVVGSPAFGPLGVRKNF